MSERVLVLDFGGQYKELIARMARELNVFSEIRPGSLSAEEIRRDPPIGIILTGGPDCVYDPGAPLCDPEILNLGIPILGICYGMQLICHLLGGKVLRAARGEYGRVETKLDADSGLFVGMPARIWALMSHGVAVAALPVGFRATAATGDCPIAACEDAARKLYGVQFHPETGHTEGGADMLRNFLFGVCGAKGTYCLDDLAGKLVEEIRREVGEKRVLLALSGGVDSSVCAALLSRAIPGQLTCIFVDHGFMRMNEGDDIERAFAGMELNFIRVNAQDRFLGRLHGVVDPEAKRRIIGEEFARVFEAESARLGDIEFLAQGTIYPDIVESGGAFGATIKSHHNVGGLPENLRFSRVIEPLSRMFKDEVRVLGRMLGLPAGLTERQPFPGPGLAIRVMGEVTREKLEILRRADAILCQEIEALPVRPQQYFAVYTGVQTVGVKGDDRTYDAVIAIRAVSTRDFMTCEPSDLSMKALSRISARITGEIGQVSRVVYDITSKPPATVEWE